LDCLSVGGRNLADPWSYARPCFRDAAEARTCAQPSELPGWRRSPAIK
jgi:hypothetical protein